MKKLMLTVLTAAAVSAMTITAYAGTWKQDSNGWWYQYDNGGYAAGTWEQINGKYYYFNESGYMLANTTTPDGCRVGADGAWIEITGADGMYYFLTDSSYVSEAQIRDGMLYVTGLVDYEGDGLCEYGRNRTVAVPVSAQAKYFGENGKLSDAEVSQSSFIGSMNAKDSSICKFTVRNGVVTQMEIWK